MMRIRVPASTSNLGPGFDCLGLALGLYLDAEVDTDYADETHAVTREGDALFAAVTDADDLFLHALGTRFDALGKARRAVRATLRSALPTARGLGSSSVAVVAGVMAADALLGRAHDPASVLAAAAKIEGHPDNVAPAVYGGLTAATMVDGVARAMGLGVPPGVVAVVVSPDAALSTKASRGVLPETVPHRLATASVGRAVMLSHALASGRHALLPGLFEDGLHQPFRSALMPGLADALLAAQKAGALGAFLSGAGSSACALVADAGGGRLAQRVGKAMHGAYAARGVTARVAVLQVASGATVGPLEASNTP